MEKGRQRTVYKWSRIEGWKVERKNGLYEGRRIKAVRQKPHNQGGKGAQVLRWGGGVWRSEGFDNFRQNGKTD